MMKRLLSLLMALCLVLGMLPVTALATEDTGPDYELRYLTFEDADYKGDTTYGGGNNWSSLIDSKQYGGSLLYPSGATTAYNWYDKNNTFLKHEFTDEWNDHQYWGGGEAISNYNSGDFKTYGSFESQLTVYKAGVTGMATTGGGHNGSNNFAVHYGYVDTSGYGGTKLQALYFGDGEARVIDHMYVNNICYALNCYYNGNDYTASIGESDWVKLEATGHHADGTTATAEIYLVNGPDNIVTDWTKWDLSGLGEITKLELNVLGSSDNGYGFSQPAYFAYDDVAVRFAKTTGSEPHTHTYGDPTWTWAEDNSTASAKFTCTAGDDTQSVDATIESTTTATCENAGKITYTAKATFGGTDHTDTKEVDAPATGHKDADNDGTCDICETKLNRVPVLAEGVDAERTVTIQTGMSYQLIDLEQGKIFTDPDGDKLTYASYFYQKSADGGQTWGERTGFTAALFGGTDMSLANTVPGTYIYKFWANDGKGDSEDTWTLTLIVKDEVLSNINFYVGQDQNYKTNGNVLPVLELYKTAGIDDEQFDYVGWFTNASGKTEYVYDPHDYTIIDGETDYVDIGGTQYELHDYEKITFTNSAFDDTDDTATASGTVVSGYNMFYASVATGRYSTRFYGYNKETEKYDIFLGGQSMPLPNEKDIYGGGGDDLYFRVVSCYTSSRKTDNTYFTAKDYRIEMVMPITGSKIRSGDSYVSGNYTYFPFMSWANGNGSLYNVYAYPEDTDSYMFNQTINNTTTPGTSFVTKLVQINTAVELTVTVPQSGEFDLYFQYNNFNTQKVEPKAAAVNNADGTKTLRYNISKGNQNYTWRLTDPSGTYVTKAGWLASMSASGEKKITFSTQTNAKSHDFSQLGTTVATRDEADIQLLSDHSGFVSTTSTKRIRAFRMWEMINSDTANIMVEPDFNVQFLQGNSSDLKQVDGGNAGGNWLDVTPTGTDIIAVSYNATDVYATSDNYSSHGGFFPATNPERTAVMVVTNQTAGTADANISFNGSKETSRGTEWDYNYDTWSYLDTDKAPTLDFTVTGTGDVSVSYALVTTNSSLQSTLSDWTTVTAGEDGQYHADLLPFRNAGTLGGTVIIRMTDSTGTSYRLARVAQMSVTVTNVDYPGEKPIPGSKVTLSFDGLYRSVNKVAGIFNPTVYYVRYTTDGTEVNGQLGQYQQLDRASITLTIPEEVEFDESGKATYTFTNGYVYGQMYSASSPFDTMYELTDVGVSTNFSAVSISMVLHHLADVTVEVAQMSNFDVTLDVTEGDTPVTGYTFTLTSPAGEVVKPDENGVYQDLPWGVYTYSLAKKGYLYQSGTMTIGDADSEKLDDNGLLHWSYTMTKGSEGCWDGTTSEPKQTDGVYQIGTGEELAWFAEYVNQGNSTASAVLTADIDLADYAWTPIGSSSSKKFAGSFDGKDHTIRNLAIYYNGTTTSAAYQGLFGYVLGTDAARASISNLKLEGKVNLTSKLKVSQADSGAVAGYAKYATITNVHNAANVTVTRVDGDWKNVGGIVGEVDRCTISKCSNSGTITGYKYAGGIGGYVNPGTIEACSNTGAIRSDTYAGGIAGLAWGASEITNSYNEATITTSGSYAGGIVGDISGTTVVSDCYNEGSIACSGGNAGGIAGQSRTIITRCYNLASVTSGTYAGGIVGYSNSGSVTNTFTTGKVTAGGDYVGGTAGYAIISSTKGTVKNNFYQADAHKNGIGYTSDNPDVKAESFKAEDLTTPAFLISLNADLEKAAFVSGESHPLLKWQRAAETFTVTIPEDAKFTITGEKTVEEGSDYSFTVEIAVGYQAGKDFAVKVNDEPVKADASGKYTVKNVSSALTITVEGVEQVKWEPVTVYFSMSHDENYITGKGNGEVMAMKEIKVPYFDLALYGMEDFYFSSENYGASEGWKEGDAPSSNLEPGTAQFAYGKITMMHLYIYATEVYYCGLEEEDAGKGYLYEQNLMGTDTFKLTGSAGSSYLSMFWGKDENLNYYLNYKYPLASEGWGSTSDQILLHDGDIITMGHFTDWNFYNDDLSVFNFLKAGDKFDKVTAKQGEKVTLTAYLAGATDSGKYDTGYTVRTSQPDIYYTAYPATSGDVTTWTKVGTAAADGTITMDTTNLQPGTYLVAMAGQYGKTLTEKIVSTPGGILLVVEEGDTVVKGDMDGSGRLTLADAVTIYNLAQSGDATSEQVKTGDMNGDGRLTLADAVAVYNAVASGG